MRRLLMVSVFLWGVCWPAELAAAADGEGSAFVDRMEKCAECHEDEVARFRETPHGRRGFADLSPEGCDTCHGPSAAHAENPTDQPLLAALSMKGLSPSDVAAKCQHCHDGAKQLFWPGSHHESRGVSCMSCHSIHLFKSDRAQLKEETAMETCFGCHKGVRAETWKTSHHPIREGRIACNDCHNPHGSPTEKMLIASSLNEQCFTCHAEKRGPFLWEHAPVRESCANCHASHGSNHLKLQKTSVPYLCQQCHSNTRHPGTLYDANTLGGAAKQSNRIFNRACLNCHASIHGSNHPSGPYLGR